MMCSVVLVIMNSKEIHMFFFVVSTLVHYIYLLWYTVSKYIDKATQKRWGWCGQSPTSFCWLIKNS